MALTIDRRRFLVLAGSATAAGVLAACGTSSSLVASTDPAVGRLEERRRRSGGRVIERTLVAAPATVDLAGRLVSTWAYGDDLAGLELRARVGDVLRVDLTNELSEPTTIHWHGIAIRNDMDGVPGLTQPAPTPRRPRGRWGP